MKLITVALLIGQIWSYRLKQYTPFKVDGVTLEIDEEEAYKDPINFEKISKEDAKTLSESQEELKSATKNAERGSMNREMATALVMDIKNGLM